MPPPKPKRRNKRKYKPVTCKYCGGQDTTHYGQYKGVRRYWCYNCQRKFKDDDTEFNMKTPKEHVNLALKLGDIPNSYSDIKSKLEYYFGHSYSTCTIFQWFKKAKRKTTIKRVKEKTIFRPLSKDDEWALYANNTGIEIIDELTREIPLTWRSDIRQEAALYYFLEGGEKLNFNEIKNIIRALIKKSKREYFKNKYLTVYLESKPFIDDDIELIDLIPDQNAENEIYKYAERQFSSGGCDPEKIN